MWILSFCVTLLWRLLLDSYTLEIGVFWMNWVLTMTLSLWLVLYYNIFYPFASSLCMNFWNVSGGSALFYCEGNRSVLFYCLVISILELECLFCLQMVCNIISICDFMFVSFCCWPYSYVSPPFQSFYVKQVVFWYSVPSTPLFCFALISLETSTYISIHSLPGPDITGYKCNVGILKTILVLGSSKILCNRCYICYLHMF